MPSLSQGQHRLYHCPEWNEFKRQIPEALRKWEQKAGISKKEWKWQRGIVTHPPSESQWNRGHFSLKKWESEKHKSWGMPAEGLKGHVATDGSLLGTTGNWGACGWSVVQLDYDEEWGALAWDVRLDGRRISAPARRAELRAYSSFLLKKSDGTHQGAC